MGAVMDDKGDNDVVLYISTIGKLFGRLGSIGNLLLRDGFD